MTIVFLIRIRICPKATKTVPNEGYPHRNSTLDSLKISPGKTKSYGEVAQAIGNPKAVRAVGSACGANPLPVLVPCHRILAANHKLGGFGGGLES